jgi:hypothetical protein
MATFTKTMTCPICQSEGEAVYREVSTTGSRLQSMDCAGGCWKGGAPGAPIIASLLAEPVVER